MPTPTPVRALLLAPLCLAAIACSTTRYRESADKETYAIIEQVTQAAEEPLPPFNVEPLPAPELAGLPRAAERHAFLGPEADYEVGAHVLSLHRALEYAFRHSREFQNRKESFYLEALSLTLERHTFGPSYGAGVSGEIHGDSSGQISEEAEAAARLGRLFRSGGELAFDLTSDFLRFISGDPRPAASSVLEATYTLPLMRGSGRRIAAERLTQAERDVLYELREFARFRKTFSVRVASDYYRVLSARDAVRNNYSGIQSFRVNLERERAFADEGLSTPAAVGRLEQAELSRQSSWINSIRRYKQALDNFKILLGLSTDAPIVLDDRELDYLREIGILHPDMVSEEAVSIGLETRLDLRTAGDRVDDAARKLDVAVDQLRPGLDLVLASALNSKDGNRLVTPDFDATEWSAGANLELPLDRKAERNEYRRAIIDYERATRDGELRADEIKLEIREAWRALDQARRNYDINVKSVELNERRVEEQDLRAELGLGNVLDQVDAQNDLTNAQNELTGQLVAHTIARLEFWRDIGVLAVLENGQWEEFQNAAD